MIKELVLVFKPADIERYIHQDNGGSRRMLNDVIAQFPDQLRGQFRLFPYCSVRKPIGIDKPDSKYAGLVYTHGEEDNPLTRVEAHDVIPSLRSLVLDPGGNADVVKGGGRIQIVTPRDENYIKFLELASDSQFDDFKAKAPDEVRRFFLNLNDEVFQRVIRPYLERKDYKLVEKTVDVPR